jgi:hypothetical protein
MAKKKPARAVSRHSQGYLFRRKEDPLTCSP